MAVAKSPLRDYLSALSAIGSEQDGYVSAAQAAAAGIDRHRLQRLEHQGILERDSRGIYRLATYPHGENGELWRAVLWPSVNRSDARGVLSHGTALSLHDVSTISPSKIDIAISPGIRLRKRVPGEYRLRFQRYAPEELTHIKGLPVTTLFRTLFDLIVSQQNRQFVEEALQRAPKQGLLTNSEAERLRVLAALHPDVLQMTLDAGGSR
jgi:predicted transcriptional regulator of viral defense system